MEKVSSHLYRSATEDPFGRGDLLTHAFLLWRESGNFLIYSSGQLEKDEAELRDFRGISRQYLNHRDEAAAHCDWVSETFGSRLICHEAEQNTITKKCTVHETFADATEIAEDLIAIPTPGHCPGSTCFLRRGPDARYLFTGDTIYFEDGVWKVFIDAKDTDTMIRSLHVIAALEFDVMLPGLYQGDIWRADVTKQDRKQKVDDIIDRLRTGAVH